MVVDFQELDSLDAVTSWREGFRCLVILRWHLVALNLISQVFDQSTILSRSCCSCSALATESIVLSAKSLIVVCGDILTTMPFTYRRKIRALGDHRRELASQMKLICHGRLVADGGRAMN